MLRNYLLSAVRNLRRNKLFSLLNIAGLALGLCACFMIWQYVRFESSYDEFHERKDRLYRVAMKVSENDIPFRKIAATHPAVGAAMKAEFPEVEEYCRVVKTSLFTNDLSTYVANALEFSREDAKGKLTAFNEEDVWFSDAPLLSMFSFQVIEGDAENALTEPNSVVITESIARKYFGNEPALGKEMKLNRQKLLKVTAVLKDIPENSHLQFDILLSFSTVYSRIGDLTDFWGWSVFYNYVLLSPNVDVSSIDEKFKALHAKHLSYEDGPVKTGFFLQPITDIHLRSSLESEQSPVSNERTVYFLSILAVFILVVAWINYINLSTAKALERAKEVGLRKTIGASKLQLTTQFLFDTLLINVAALAMSVVIAIATWPLFEALVGKSIGGYVATGGITPWLIAAAVFVGGIVISGVYPALALSSFSPAAVLKSGFLKASSGMWLRKLMISFQYVLALLLIAGTVTIYRQLSFMRSQETGFTSEQVAIIEAPAVSDETSADRTSFFKTNALKVNGVRNISATADVPGKPIVETAVVGLLNASQDNDFISTDVAAVDTSFFSTYKIDLLDGRMFNEHERMKFRRVRNADQSPADESIGVIVNEQFVKRLGFNDRKEIIGQMLKFNWGPDIRIARVVGVSADHHQVSFKEGLRPVMYMQPGWMDWQYFSVVVKGDIAKSVRDLQAAYAQAAYAQAFPGNPFTLFFLDQYFDQQYKDDQQFGRIFNVFTSLAIIVTTLGLFGLSLFAVKQRTKEVAIRKVLGASVASILALFSTDFMKVLMISYVTAAPVIYWAGGQWLERFTFRAPLGWVVFVAPLMLLMIITLITIGAVCARAAIETPVSALKSE